MLAIAAGACDGLGFGHNARAALITRGLAEATRLAVGAWAATRETLMGLAGLGDLVLTCTGDLSRNRRVGLALARGERLPAILAALGHVAEGVDAARAARALALHHGVEMPICEAVDRVLHEDMPVARRRRCAARSRAASRAPNSKLMRNRDARCAIAPSRSSCREPCSRDASWRSRVAAPTAARSVRPPTPARPVVETLHGVTLTDRYRWLENGKDRGGRGMDARAARGDAAYLDRNAPPVPGLTDELARYFDRDMTDAPFFKKGREFFQRTSKGEPQAKLFTRLDGKDVLLFDPIALDPHRQDEARIDRAQSRRVEARRRHLREGIGDPAISASSTRAPARDRPSRSPASAGSAGRATSVTRYMSPRTAESDARQEPHEVLPPSARQRSQGRRAADRR